MRDGDGNLLIDEWMGWLAGLCLDEGQVVVRALEGRKGEGDKG